MLYTTAQAAKQISVCKNTLLRWLYEGLIPDVGRDWRGWRSWSERDINRAKAFRQAYHSKPIRRAKRTPINRAECAKAASESMVRFAEGYAKRPEVGM
jgi:predicted site-specific integrase-resolvase